VSGSAASAPEASAPVAAEPTEDGAAFRIQAVDRAVLLLKSVATSTTPPTVLELARACGINRSTAWRLLRTLEYHGLIDRDPVTQRYTVGYGAITIAAAVTDDTLVRRVRPLLKDLSARTEESVLLAVARRFNLVYVDQVDPPHVMAPHWLDKPLPLHATSGGKAFLAWLGPDERDAILPGRTAALHLTHHHPAKPAGTRARRGQAGGLCAVCVGVRGVFLRRLRGGAELTWLPDGGGQCLGSHPA
jgi:DNA-binding IclR family transcriptional regulator